MTLNKISLLNLQEETTILDTSGQIALLDNRNLVQTEPTHRLNALHHAFNS